MDRCCFPIKNSFKEGGIEKSIKFINAVKVNEAEKKKKNINKLARSIDGREEKQLKYDTTPVIRPKKKDSYVASSKCY